MSSPPLLPFNNNNNYIYDDSANYSNNNTTSSHAHPMDNLKPTLLTLLLILFVTLLLSVSFCLLLRHLNRRCLRLLSSSSSSPSSASPSSVTSNRNVNRVSPDDPATSSLLDSLPIFTFSSIKRRSSSSADCAVCLSKFEEVDRLRLLPLCCHAFHVGCIDTWLQSNQTCPLCRSPISASESDLVSKALLLSTADEGTVSFRLEIGSISRRRDPVQADQRSSYSLGSFDYEVDQESEIPITWTHARSISDNKDIAAADTPVDPESLAADVASGRSWLKDYVDRLSISLSSRAMSFRGSGSFFTGSSRRSDVVMAAAGDGDLEASRVGEEISEMFRWLSGV